MNIKQASAATLIAATLFVGVFGSITAGIQWLGLNLDGLLAGALIADVVALGVGYMLRPAFRLFDQAKKA